MKILVTGGAGFIGSHTVDALLKKGHEVKVLDSLEQPVHAGKPDYIPKEVEFIHGDVRNKEDWVKALNGVDAVFHLAAYQDYLTDFSKFFHVNSVGTALLYEVAVEKVLPLQKVVVASSQAAYGEGKYRCSSVGCRFSYKDYGSIYPNVRPLEQLERGEWEIKCPGCGGAMEPEPAEESRVNPHN